MHTMTILTRGIATLGAAGLLSLGLATTASADHINPPTGADANSAENWVEYVTDHGYEDVECSKLTSGWDGVEFTASDDFALVVLKNATHNDEFWDVEDGETIETVVHEGEQQHAISHVIVCTGTKNEATPTPTPTPTTTSTPTPTPSGPIVETDVPASGSGSTAVLGGAAVLAGLGIAAAALRRKGQH